MSDILLQDIIIFLFRPGMRNLPEENISASTQVITSMYLRREKQKTMKVGRSTHCLIGFAFANFVYEYFAKKFSF